MKVVTQENLNYLWSKVGPMLNDKVGSEEAAAIRKLIPNSYTMEGSNLCIRHVEEDESIDIAIVDMSEALAVSLTTTTNEAGETLLTVDRTQNIQDSESTEEETA